MTEKREVTALDAIYGFTSRDEFGPVESNLPKTERRKRNAKRKAAKRSRKRNR